MSSNDTYQFRGKEVGEAIDLLDERRVGGVNKSELAREGLKTVLREITTPDEKAEVFAMYQRGEIEEGVARVFLGDDLDTMRDDAAVVAEAVDDDTSDLIQ